MAVRPYPLVLFLVACSSGSIAIDETDDTLGPIDTDEPDTDVPDTEPVDTDEPEPPAPTFPEYDDAQLDVRFPEPAAIYTLDRGIPYDARVVDGNGDPLPFEDFGWNIHNTVITGRNGFALVPPGIYTVEVAADLPNGDRVRAAVGGVRVQAPTTGVWTGSVAIAAFTDVQGQEIRSDCVGNLDFVVDLAGETVTGSGGCTLALPLVGTIPLTYDVTGVIVGPAIEQGALLLDIPFLQVPVAFEGGFPTASTMRAQFAEDLDVLRVEGEISARKVTGYVGP